MTDKTKNILIWGSAGVIVVGGLIYVFYFKNQGTSSSSTNTTATSSSAIPQTAPVETYPVMSSSGAISSSVASNGAIPSNPANVINISTPSSSANTSAVTNSIPIPAITAAPDLTPVLSDLANNQNTITNASTNQQEQQSLTNAPSPLTAPVSITTNSIKTPGINTQSLSGGGGVFALTL